MKLVKTPSNFLDKQLSATGIKPTPFHQQKALNILEPTGKPEIKTLMGLATWLAPHIPNLSDIMAPISYLQRDGVPFDFNDECKAALAKFKSLVTNPKILKYPDYNKPFEIVCDASDRAIGAALLKEIGWKTKYYRILF